MAGIKDVARRAGVSISTVSNVMNGSKTVSRELEKKVLESVEYLGYHANPIASGLRSSRSNTIGVIITSFQRVFFGQILKGIQDTVVKQGYMVSVFDSDNDFEKEKKYVRHFADSMVDGVILLSMADDCKDPEYINMLENLGNHRKKIPVVSLERGIGNANIDVVMSDNYLAGRSLMEHLLQQGHRQIGHITGPVSMTMCRQRLSAYMDSLRETGVTPQDEWIQNGDFSPNSGYMCMRELLKQAPSLTAVFAANDQMAVGAMKAIKEFGFRVPEDIAVAGFDNIFPSTLVSPSLTTVHIATYQIGVMSAEQIIKRLNGELTGPGKTTILKTQLIVRKSTDLQGDSTWDLGSW